MRIVTWIAVGAIAGYLGRVQARRMARDRGPQVSAAGSSTTSAPSVSNVTSTELESAALA
jgi:hypothetical protein